LALQKDSAHVLDASFSLFTVQNSHESAVGGGSEKDQQRMSSTFVLQSEGSARTGLSLSKVARAIDIAIILQ
jgi:hypothetical protein